MSLSIPPAEQVLHPSTLKLRLWRSASAATKQSLVEHMYKEKMGLLECTGYTYAETISHRVTTATLPANCSMPCFIDYNRSTSSTASLFSTVSSRTMRSETEEPTVIPNASLRDTQCSTETPKSHGLANGNIKATVTLKRLAKPKPSIRSFFAAQRQKDLKRSLKSSTSRATSRMQQFVTFLSNKMPIVMGSAFSFYLGVYWAHLTGACPPATCE